MFLAFLCLTFKSFVTPMNSNGEEILALGDTTRRIYNGMALVQPMSNKITLWQGFSTFGGQIDLLVIYEPTHLKVVMQLNSSTKDLISVEFMGQQMCLVTRESGFRKTCSGNRTSCWSEETKRSLWIPFPTNPKMAQWEENNNILSVSIPWLSV